MKKSKIIIITILLAIFIVSAFLPQNDIIGGWNLARDIVHKMEIAIVLISIYFLARFHKKGIMLYGAIIPMGVLGIIFGISMYTNGIIFNNLISIISFILLYVAYYTMYLNELVDKKK